MNSFDETTKTWKGAEAPYPRDTHISEIILDNLKKTPNRVLQVYDVNGAEMTCEELRLKATRVAQNLAKLGISKGDVVGFDCSNTENISALIHGCIFIGAVSSPMSLFHSAGDLIQIWSLTEPKLIFCDADAYEKVVEVVSVLKKDIIVCTLIERLNDVMYVDDILAATGDEENFKALKCENSENSLIALISSSGTSGPAKAVRVQQSYFILLAEMLKGVEKKFLNFAPIFWIVSFSLFVIPPMTNLIRVVTSRLETVDNILELIEKFQIEHLYSKPAILNQILQSPLIETANLSPLKMVTSAGAILYPDLRIRFKNRFPGKHLISLYGSTEIIFVMPLISDDNEGYAAGRPIKNAEVKIVDEDGNNLGINEKGEICAKTIFPFSGYYGASEAVVDDDNFYKTGDIGYFDQRGILNIIDRKKDIFKYYLYHASSQLKIKLELTIGTFALETFIFKNNNFYWESL